MDLHTDTPNHHAHFPLLTGWKGAIAALSMAFGRSGDRSDIVIGLAGVQPGECVLDIGCGPGLALRRAARLDAQVIGVDPVPVMRRMARLLTLRGRIDVRDGAAEHLLVDDGSVDVAWSVATVHHWRDIDAGLAEVRRVLRSNGRFLALERHVPDGAKGLATHGWRPAQAAAFAQACERAGFVHVTIERAGPMHAVVAVS